MDMMNISSLSQYASDIASNKATDELKNKASAAQTDDELLSACKEFESYLWEQVLNSMKKTADVFKDKEESNSQMVDYFMDSAVSKVASDMTEQTSTSKNSLAMQMYEQMKRTNTIDIEKLFAENDSEN
ncbi:MAG: hypothetical protein IKR70_00680 [Lachnospiraceae bacterium]|nr:hypothetical protein [Lachnospiraceae bacterium]